MEYDEEIEMEQQFRNRTTIINHKTFKKWNNNEEMDNNEEMEKK
jgi:hypothetical protein